MMQNN